MSPRIAYLAQGKLHFKTGDAAPKVVESRFAQTVRDRALRLQRQHSWKTSGRGARFMAGGLVWGQAERDPAEMRMVITSLSRGRVPGELLYTLDAEDITGIFAVRDAGDDELRLSHSADRHVQFVSAQPGRESILCSVLQKMGNSSIAVKHLDSGGLTEVTEGDSVDLAPRWAPGTSQEIVFQSAGIIRDQNGAMRGTGPATIQQLHLETGAMACLAEDPDNDLLSPQLAADGALYYIRRPHRSPHAPVNPLRLLWGVILMPFRVLFAIFQWLNFFTVRNTGQPLLDARGAKQQQMDLRRMMILGNWVNAEQALREAQRAGEEAPALVPKSWQLIRRTKDGEEQVVAKGVLSYDLGSDGRLIYTNGSAIYQAEPSGRRVMVHRDNLIEQVVALD